MTTEETLDLALEVLQINLKLLEKINPYKGQEDLLSDSLDLTHKAITAIKQARSAPVQEPVAWKWHQAPVKTSWGHDMVVADLAIDKDNTVSVYCERDQTAKVEAMFNPPAVPAPLQEPVAWIDPADGAIIKAHVFKDDSPPKGWRPIGFIDAPHAAQRQWVGLTDEEVMNATRKEGHELLDFIYEYGTGSEGTEERVVAICKAIEAKLKEKNT